MKSFLKAVILFSIPFWILVLLYVITDIYKVIWHYDPYYDESYYIDLNRAYGSTMTYINQNPKYHYDSFIFGNSRSLFYEIDTWKKYLPVGSHCMHFDASGGTVKGLYDKVRYIDKTGGQLNHALLVIDWDLLSRDPRSAETMEGDYLMALPPILTDNETFVSFHFRHFNAFMNFKFLTALLGYNLLGDDSQYWGQFFLVDDNKRYIPEYNETQFVAIENRIKEGRYYDVAHTKVFENAQSPNIFSPEVLDDEKITYLNEIKKIFEKHHTSYKIIISPLYDQMKLKRATYMTLCDIFGKQNVYDFSGVNKWNRDYHNYYETSHYRPKVAAEILEIIYSESDEKIHKILK